MRNNSRTRQPHISFEPLEIISFSCLQQDGRGDLRLGRFFTSVAVRSSYFQSETIYQETFVGGERPRGWSIS